MATTRNTGRIMEPWAGTGWPLHLFVDQKALTRKEIYFCARLECTESGQKIRRILREPWELTCGHRLCKKCLDLILLLPEDQRECDACKFEIFDDRSDQALEVDHVNADRQTRSDTMQLKGNSEVQLPGLQWEPRFCKIDCKGAIKDNAANRELNRMMVRCPYDCGTSSKLTVRTIEKHMSTCEERLVPCGKCTEFIRYSQRSAHAANKCPSQDVDCPDRCGPEGLEYGDPPKHLAECKKTQPRCIFCRIDYLSNEVIRDHMTKCVAKCPLGCSESSARVNMEEHLGNPELLKSHLYNISLLFYNVKVKEEEGASPGAGMARIQIAFILEKLLQLESKDESLKRKSLAMCLCAVNGGRGLSTAAEGAASERGGEIDSDMAALADSEDSSGRSNTSDEETVNFDAIQAKADLLCKVCYNQLVGAVLQPCAHMVCRGCADIAVAAARAVEAARAMNAVARAVEAARAMNAALDDDVMAKCPICRKVVTGSFTANF